MNKSVNKQGDHNPRIQRGRRPDIRDDLDSREHEEQAIKGTDITHNKKKKKGPARNLK